MKNLTNVLERGTLDGKLQYEKVTARKIYFDKAGQGWVSYAGRKHGKKATPVKAASHEYVVEYASVTINGGKSGQAFSDAVAQAKRKAKRDYLRSLGLNIYG